MEAKIGVIYTDGTDDIVVASVTEKMINYYPDGDTTDKPKRMMKETFFSRFHEKAIMPVPKVEQRSGRIHRAEPANSHPAIVMAKTPAEALQLDNDVLQSPRRPGKATMAKFKAKWEKRFKKDLRYGSRKAKVEAKRALGL